ncbi:MAG: hypothetical protein EA403_01750 [Spirochaetaceae bacterium]|nr:MAG: hypothetical protein EA403_01750 [Spirochaetaceae bacterium]
MEVSTMRMQRFLILLATLLLIVAGASWAQVTARVSEVSGRVELREGTGAWRPATVGAAVTPGTTISTGFGAAATVQLGESILRVRELTRMTIEDLAEREGVLDTSLFLRVGRVRSEVRSAEGLQNNFQLRSTQATAAVRGTSFEFDGVNLFVDEGVVAMGNILGKEQTLGQGQTGSADGYDRPQGPQQILNEQSTVQSSTSPDGPPVPSVSGDTGLVVIRIQWN